MVPLAGAQLRLPASLANTECIGPVVHAVFLHGFTPTRRHEAKVPTRFSSRFLKKSLTTDKTTHAASAASRLQMRHDRTCSWPSEWAQDRGRSRANGAISHHVITNPSWRRRPDHGRTDGYRDCEKYLFPDSADWSKNAPTRMRIRLGRRTAVKRSRGRRLSEDRASSRGLQPIQNSVEHNAFIDEPAAGRDRDPRMDRTAASSAPTNQLP